MTSPSFIDRLTRSQGKSPILPLHRSRQREASSYDLDELEPRSEDGLLYDAAIEDSQVRATSSRATSSKAASSRAAQSPSPTRAWMTDPSPPSSPSHRNARPLFAGPPPPIAASIMRSPASPSGSDRYTNGSTAGLVQSSRANIGSILFQQRPEAVVRPVDSVWRSLRRTEDALERDVQELLDQQAAGLVAGSGGLGREPSSQGDTDGHSDAGSSTPTGTFYSTATSKSRMAASLYVPAEAGPDGNVIPIRQPRRRRPPGLRAVRRGLLETMLAMSDLKQEEDSRIHAALKERKDALARLGSLSKRREGISKELQELEEDDEEPLGRELRELGTEYDSLSSDIRVLEEKLVKMRNRRRQVRNKMKDTANKRDAGLSGYRGALQNVNTEVATMLKRPPVQPLDAELLGRQNDSTDAEAAAATGLEFLRLIPERRTGEMAKTWWEAETQALEKRRAQIKTEWEALESGSQIWEDVMQRISDFESSLRLLMRAAPSPEPKGKGKEKMLTREEAIRSQLPIMEATLRSVETDMLFAERKGWNLLICAIGAELEAFREAFGMLRAMFAEPADDRPGPSVSASASASADGSHALRASGSQNGEAPASHDHHLGADHHPDESDNEVPADLLVSHAEESYRAASAPPSPAVAQADSPGPKARTSSQRSESENEVPPEFLAEHEDDDTEDSQTH